MAKSGAVFLPQPFLDIVRDALPPSQTLDSFIAACQRPLRRSLRVNTLKISVEDFLHITQPYGWQLTQIPWCKTGFWIEREEDHRYPLGNSAEHLSGLFYIQEASSMLPVAALFSAIAIPECILDVAAAPGSKTTQIAAAMHNDGLIIANEYAASRVKVLHANLTRCGVANTAVTHFDGRVFGAALPERFDAVLLDAPCSGEGVVRKDPEALRNWSLSSSESIATTQRDLIDSAFHALRPGGTMVYSTCTLNPLENQQVCLWLKERYPDSVTFLPLGDLFDGASAVTTPEGFLHVFPQVFDSEGFFVALIRKQTALPPLPTPSYRLGKFPFTPLIGRAADTLQKEAAKAGIHWQDNLTPWQRDKEIWLLPARITPFLTQIRFSRVGFRLAEQHNKGFRWQHEAVIALTHANSAHAFTLTREEAECWYRGQDIYPELPIIHDHVIVTYQGAPLGLARKVGSRLKNSYPREWVRDSVQFQDISSEDK